jgi:hypothetical protein
MGRSLARAYEPLLRHAHLPWPAFVQSLLQPPPSSPSGEGLDAGGHEAALMARIRIMSTDTGRTALSATAFAKGLIEQWQQWQRGNGSGTAPPRPYDLHVISRFSDPVMAAKYRTKECPRIRAQEAAQAAWIGAFSAAPADVATDLAWLTSGALGLRTGETGAAAPPAVDGATASLSSRLDGALEGRLPGVEVLADDLFTRVCHGQPLPCFAVPGSAEKEQIDPQTGQQQQRRRWRWQGVSPSPSRAADKVREALAYATSSAAAVDGADESAASPLTGLEREHKEEERCMSPRFARRIIELADRHYERRYSAEGTRVLSHLLLKQVETMMADVLDGKDDFEPRVVVRAAHDTVIAPLLTALGLRERSFAWPGYAARIVIELWAHEDALVHANTTAVDAADRLASSARVRILYDGRDITPQSICSGECSFAEFRTAVQGLLGNYTSIDEACAIPGEHSVANFDTLRFGVEF